MKLHFGILSLLLIAAAFVLGAIGVFMISVTYGVLYLVMLGIGTYVVLMNYCRKCPHSMNNSCRHIYPGRIAIKLPYKKTGKYTWFELISVIIVVGILIFYPLAFMYTQLWMTIVYVLILITGVVMIRSKVCNECYNRWCPACPNRVKQ